jgi:hypothetical protein
VELVVHVTPDHLADSRDPVVRVVTGGERAALVEQVRSWCGNPAAAVTVLPLLDLAGHQSSTSYETPGRLRRQTEHLAHGHCTFPWCTRPAARCDRDHAVPHDEGGRTCSCNLHPLCRRHHRFKTEAGWRVRAVEPGAWHWTDPFEHRYRRDESGTRELEPPSPVPEGRVGSSAGPSAGRSAGGMAVLVSSSGCFRSPTPAWATPPNTLRVPV